MQSNRIRYDRDTVKAAAARHGWEQVIQETTGHVIPGGKGNQPCPLCGGDNRFHRKEDFPKTGAVHCRHCHAKRNGDGLAFIMKAMDWKFPETLKAVADVVGCRPEERPSTTEPAFTKSDWDDLRFDTWGLKYPGITRAAVEKAGGIMGRHGKINCLIIPVFDSAGKTVNRKALTLGEYFTFAKGERGNKKIIGGKPDGFSGFVPDECRILIKTEGYPDMLAILSADLPDDVGVLTNAFGASTVKPKLIEPLAAKADEVWIIGDCDEPGQRGADKFAATFANFKPTKNVALPYPVAETKGRDLRDWLVDGGTFAALEELANAADFVDAGELEDQFMPEEIYEADDDPHRLAVANIKEYRIAGRDLKFWNGQFWRYRDGQYIHIQMEELRAKVSAFIRKNLERRWLVNKENADQDKRAGKEPEQERPVTKVTRTLTSNVIEAMSSLVVLKSSVVMPSWLPDQSEPEYLNLKNGLLDIEALLDGEDDFLKPHSPDWFDSTMLPFEFDADAECPRWSEFLKQVFTNDEEQADEEQIKALQMWFGYCLTSQTILEKMVFIIGPRRSGKGTILKVITGLLGAENVVSPTSDSLAEQFGLQPLIGRKLATITDARFSGRHALTTVERLLTIASGESISIPIKHREAVNLRLKTRFMIASNELPRLPDKSNALAGRMICLETPNSFYDREDVHLESKLKEELPGILQWSLMGLHALRKNGKIQQPTTTIGNRDEMMEQNSPVTAFLNDCCILEGSVEFEESNVEEGLETELDQFYRAYKLWCKSEGRNHISTKNVFGRDLKSQDEKITSKRKSPKGKKGRKITYYSGVVLKDFWRIESAETTFIRRS